MLDISIERMRSCVGSVRVSSEDVLVLESSEVTVSVQSGFEAGV